MICSKIRVCLPALVFNLSKKEFQKISISKAIASTSIFSKILFNSSDSVFLNLAAVLIAIFQMIQEIIELLL